MVMDTGQWLSCFDSCQLTILWMSYIKDVDLPRHAWDTPPFLLIVSPTPPIQSVDAYVCTYVRTLGQSRDNQTKRGWPYSMSVGLCPTRASRAWEPRYETTRKSFLLLQSNNLILLLSTLDLIYIGDVGIMASKMMPWREKIRTLFIPNTGIYVISASAIMYM